ncbi:MAG: hypothetical protein LCH85_20700 [Chloroflexi bacterium]|nr:hypothetical protein [Chloroflexota bacterium]
MAAMFIGITVICYAVAILLWLRFRSYRYLLVLIAGHCTIVAEPILQRLYSLTYPDGVAAINLFGNPVPIYALLAASWIGSLPVLLMYFGQQQHWWTRHYLTGVVAYVALVLYHIIIQGLAARTGLWRYSQNVGAWGINFYLLMAVFAGLSSLLLFYAMVASRYYAAEIAVPTLVAASIGSPLICFGLLGAPFWLPRLIGSSGNFTKPALLVIAGLVLWVVHLASAGIHASRQQHVIER